MRLGLAALLLLALTACGGSDSGGDAAPTPSASPTSAASSPSESPTDDQADELQAAVQAYSDAYLTGDGAGAYALLSQRCQDRETRAEFTAIVTAAGDQYGDALPLKSFDAEVSGDLARATYTYSVAEINQDAEPWVREGGGWREDDC